MIHPYGDVVLDVSPDDPSERSVQISLNSRDDHGTIHRFEFREHGHEGAERLRLFARALNDAADAIEAGEKP